VKMILRLTSFVVGVRDDEDVDDFLSQLEDFLNEWDSHQDIESYYDYTTDGT